MAYDPNKDILIWEAPTSPDGLIIQIRSYSGGDPKIRFSRTFTRKTGEQNTQPAYSLSMEDIVYMGNFWNHICQTIKQSRASKTQQQQQGVPYYG